VGAVALVARKPAVHRRGRYDLFACLLTALVLGLVTDREQPSGRVVGAAGSPDGRDPTHLVVLQASAAMLAVRVAVAVVLGLTLHIKGLMSLWCDGSRPTALCQTARTSSHPLHAAVTSSPRS
jgi:hypothetical protein